MVRADSCRPRSDPPPPLATPTNAVAQHRPSTTANVPRMAAGAETLKRTPLYDRHVEAGARLVPFAGWEMPVQYAGIREEHLAVRQGVGVFDLSHMGEIETSGP